MIKKLFIAKKPLFVSVFLLLASCSQAWYIYGGPGVAYYQGDVAETGFPHLSMLKFNGKIGVGYHLRRRWDLRLHASYGNLHGSDQYTGDEIKRARGVTFNTRVIDGGVTLKYNGLFNSRSKWINYGFFGVDYMNMAVDRQVTGVGALVAEDPFSSHQFNAPIGIGVGKWLNKHWGLVGELSYHFAFTDYVDGTSLSGNPRAWDSFTALHLLLIYRFRGRGTGRDGVFDPSNLNNVDCPRF